MGLVDSVGASLLKKRLNRLERTMEFPNEVQQETLKDLLDKGRYTVYGRSHGFESIKTTAEFKERVPLANYEDLYPYIARLLEGEQNVLWPTRIKSFAKSSGTTGAKSKIIPVSFEGLNQCHYQGGRDMLALYLRNYPGSKIFSGKNLSIGGSQESNYAGRKKGFYTGNISAIVMKNLPFWAQLRRTPGLGVTMMNNWEEKIKKIADITRKEKVTSMAGSPMWILLLLQHIIEEGKSEYIQDIWPDLEVFFHGAVSFLPYRPLYEKLDRDQKLRYLEIYNATEGFFGLQDQVHDPSLLLMLHYGIYYEFIPEKDYLLDNPRVLSLDEVELGKNYSMVISTNSGLWRYKIGDTIKFTSLHPYRFIISGRTKHCINIFGEDLFTEHAEKALAVTCKKTGAILKDYTAAPFFYETRKKGYHEWLVEFVRSPLDLEEFTTILDEELSNLNDDYAQKRKENIAIEKPVVREVPTGSFYEWLKRHNKLGGQHKIPRLSNSRELVEEILEISRAFASVGKVKKG